MNQTDASRSHSNRAGRYIRQLAGYRAFYPTALPPDPPIGVAGGLQIRLSEADQALGRLDGIIQTLPNPDLFVFMYVRKEAVLSSQIEGTQSSLQDVLAAEARILDPDRPLDVGEVVNYVRALNLGLQRLNELPVSIRLIKEIHHELLKDVRGSRLAPGELRTSQNWIGPGGCTLRDATFIPPPPDHVPTALGELELFLHGDVSLPILVKVGLAHAQFETIHPFLDGNGRLGRLLITFLLCEKAVLQKPVLYLSHFFKANRQEYYDRLQAVRDRGEWEAWLEFFLRGVSDVGCQAADVARSILRLREKHRYQITDTFGRAAANGHRLLEILYQRPIVQVQDVQNLLGASYAVSNDVVKRFSQCGILEERTGQSRNRRFQYSSYIELFDDDRPGTRNE